MPDRENEENLPERMLAHIESSFPQCSQIYTRIRNLTIRNLVRLPPAIPPTAQEGEPIRLPEMYQIQNLPPGAAEDASVDEILSDEQVRIFAEEVAADSDARDRYAVQTQRHIETQGLLRHVAPIEILSLHRHHIHAEQRRREARANEALDADMVRVAAWASRPRTSPVHIGIEWEPQLTLAQFPCLPIFVLPIKVRFMKADPVTDEVLPAEDVIVQPQPHNDRVLVHIWRGLFRKWGFTRVGFDENIGNLEVRSNPVLLENLAAEIAACHQELTGAMVALSEWVGELGLFLPQSYWHYIYPGHNNQKDEKDCLRLYDYIANHPAAPPISENSSTPPLVRRQEWRQAFHRKLVVSKHVNLSMTHNDFVDFPQEFMCNHRLHTEIKGCHTGIGSISPFRLHVRVPYGFPLDLDHLTTLWNDPLMTALLAKPDEKPYFLGHTAAGQWIPFRKHMLR